MSSVATGPSIEEIRATIKESVKEAVSAGFLEHGHALETLKKGRQRRLFNDRRSPVVIKERIAELTKRMDQIES
eukprot:12870189-Prorocentrum_lima.AAC.1